MYDTSEKGKIIYLRWGITVHAKIKMDLFTHKHTHTCTHSHPTLYLHICTYIPHTHSHTKHNTLYLVVAM